MPASTNAACRPLAEKARAAYLSTGNGLLQAPVKDRPDFSIIHHNTERESQMYDNSAYAGNQAGLHGTNLFLESQNNFTETNPYEKKTKCPQSQPETFASVNNGNSDGLEAESMRIGSVFSAVYNSCKFGTNKEVYNTAHEFKCTIGYIESKEGFSGVYDERVKSLKHLIYKKLFSPVCERYDAGIERWKKRCHNLSNDMKDFKQVFLANFELVFIT